MSLTALSGAPLTEEESLQANIHAPALKRLGLTRLVKHCLEAAKVGVFEYFLDAIVYFRLKLLLTHLLEFLNLAVDSAEVDTP